MSTSLNQLNEELREKIADYENALAFVQSELIADRAKLGKAKLDNQPVEVINMILEDIAKLEKGVDQYQGWLKLFQEQLQKNES